MVVGDRFFEPGLGLDDVPFLHGLDAQPDRVGVDGVGFVRGAAAAGEDQDARTKQDRQQGQGPVAAPGVMDKPEGCPVMGLSPLSGAPLPATGWGHYSPTACVVK